MAGTINHKSSRQWWIITFSIIAALLAATSLCHLPGCEELAFVETKEFVKPKNVKIVGIVPFNRESRVEILSCYVKRNQVDNGGWLDEVHWFRNNEEEDLEYLDEILANSPRYKKIDPTTENFERGNIYVKIDGDVVWIADDAIPRIVTMKLDHPEFLLVSANLINSHSTGAMHSHLPEFGLLEPPEHHNSWRAAQEYHSFLKNLATSRPDKPWSTDYNIIFFCLYADDVLDNLPITVDKEWLPVLLPAQISKSITVERHALAVHLGPQGDNEKMTGLLAGYYNYAWYYTCSPNP